MQDRATRAGYPPTDHSRWRLKVKDGRQTWHYLRTDAELAAWPQTNVERYWLGMPLTDIPHHEKPAATPLESAHRAFVFITKIQTADGHWASEYGGPMFLLPGLIISCHVCGVPIAEEFRQEYIRYLICKANEDGGWGLHIEGPSTVIGTALNYAAIRLLGMPAAHHVAVAARKRLHELGGASASPLWGKFWLCVLGVYEWQGINPVPPETWLLPYAVPLHPGRWWCHMRMVYLPMSYCYARRVRGEESEVVRQLREELYTVPYDVIEWDLQRNNVSAADLYYPHTKFLDSCNVIFTLYERVVRYMPFVRDRAVREVLRQIKMEDTNTDYADLGPVNKVMNMVCMWHAYGPGSDEFQRHIPRLQDFIWMTGKGMLMNGTNGTQLWDTAFCVQAAIESRFLETAATPDSRRAVCDSLLRAYEFIDRTQMTEEVAEISRCYRYSRRGGWPFSTRDQGYTVSDATAEAMKAILMLHHESGEEPHLPPFERRRLDWAVDVLLGMQNTDGGYGSYEPTRGPKLLELLNSAEVFGNIMVEYSYPECTTAVITALSKYSRYYPDYRNNDIRRCLQKAILFISRSQRDDGGYFGSWAICFTYSTMFALESYQCVGETWSNSENVRKACKFLLSKQNPDGGWGESFRSCETAAYVQHPDGSQVVNTAWAVLGLIHAQVPVTFGNGALRRGIELIMKRQLQTGDWAQEGIEGVFNKSCTISYPNYKLIFTTWALGLYARFYEGADARAAASASHSKPENLVTKEE